MSDLIPVDDEMSPDARPIDLRDYQFESVGALRQGIKDGKTNQVLCAPTGAGKTTIAAYLLREAFRLGKRACFVVERNSLIDQTSAVLDTYGIPHGVVQGNHPRKRPGAKIQICSAQTLTRRGWPACDLLIYDEAHLNMKVVLDKLNLRKCRGIGLTATPYTPGMAKTYDGMVQVTTTNKLTAEGHLVPFKGYAAAEPDMDGVKISKGEWDAVQSTARATQIVGDVVSEYLGKTPGEKFLCFGVTVEHCKSLRAQFMAAGIRCELHTYDIPDDIRKAHMDEFRRPSSAIRGLLAVSSLARGLDVPDCAVCIMAKPIRKSLAEFIQILGRVLRPFPDKPHATILDLAGNLERFWGQMQNVFENGAPPLLSEKEANEKEKPKSREKKPAKCPACSHVFPGGPICPACGYVFPVKSPIEHAAGVLRAFLGGQPVALTPEAKAQLLGELRQMQIEGGGFAPRKLAWVGMQFKGIVGYFPKVDFATIAPLSPSEATRDRVRDLFRAWKSAQA